MDIQKLFDAISASSRDTRKNYHLTLGGLVDLLSGAGDMPVVFDKGGSPTLPHSYRGYYDDLSFDSTDEKVSASRVLEGARNCIGRTFEGYKGGDYTMSEDTPLWCAPYGRTGPAIIGGEVKDGSVILHTKQVG